MARFSNDTSSSTGPTWLVYALLLIAGLLLIWRFWFTGTPDLGNDPTAASRPIAPPGPQTSEEQQRIEIFKNAQASVVNVTSAQLQRNPFTLNSQQVPKGTGTG